MAKKNNPYKNYSKPLSPPVIEVSSNIEIGNINVSASTRSVPVSTITTEGFEFSNSQIIPAEIIKGAFAPQDPSSSIELFIYDINKNIIAENYNYEGWEITENTIPPVVPTTFTDSEGIEQQENSTGSLPTSLVQVNPAGDAYDLGIDSGEIYTLYNFLTNELGSSNNNTFYIAEISGDRTEVRLKSNTIDNSKIIEGYGQLKNKLASTRYFDEFYINFFNNIYSVGINCLLDENPNEGISILIKTFSPIPANSNVGDSVYVVTKQSETLAWSVDFYEDFSDLLDNATYIKGPNVNISLQDLVNNSTTLKSQTDLLNTSSSESLDSVLNYLNQTGVTITPNYSYNTFNEFINFSSAKERINNFYEKVSQIQAYQADIDIIVTTTGSNPNVSAISQSLASLQTNISNLIENFDGYENYLYYNSSSFAYPKTGSAYPYTLMPTGSTEVIEWMGSDDENSQYYGGYILSASLYDEDNQNWLWYTIPSFITENSENDEYVSFSNMVGQSFDEVWLYTKALSERYNTTNNPDTGLPLDLAAEAIKGLGFETFGNNYDNQDNFIGLTGEDNGTYVPPTGSELITQYIAVNGGQILNYWDIGYSWDDYVEQILDPGFPYAIDKVSKEIYKRLYHNMAYLTKKKGTISGLRQLINIWGIPNTILRINEFGGKNRDNTDDYDLWYKRYSYAYTPVGNSYAASSSVKVPWMPLQRNRVADNKYIVPDGIALRFKTIGHPSSSFGGSYYSQSIAVKKSNGTADNKFDWGISLFYEDQPSGTYSGSSFSDYYDYGKLRFYLSGSTSEGGVAISDDIELPFFDGGWWTVLLQRNTHVSASDPSQSATYTLFAANKLDNGWDGNSIGWTGSVSLSSQAPDFFEGYDGGFYESVTYDLTNNPSYSLNDSWNKFGVTEHDGVYVGGYISGSNVGVNVLNEGGKIFSGSFQEFRYYSNDIEKTVFNDFVMNPESIEGNNITGSESSFDIVNFRAPLGNELEHIFTASALTGYVEEISSSHPAVTGSSPVYVVTQSFVNPADISLTSSYDFIHYESTVKRTYSKTNVETYFLDQPSIGIRNRVSNKIQVEDGEVYGNVLSKYRSIQQNYLISESYTEDISSLEVGFSPQDEVNDDIIASFGYGVISDTLADPRFAFSGSQTYYPKLRSIANDYFKKYTEGNVWDYLRLIKYFDNSIFKAIKSYVPARTSVTTGVIVKQHMLERNRRVPVTVDPNTIIAYTPETGSIVGSGIVISGQNSPISYRNLEITGSMDIGTIEGGTGGVLDIYNGEVTQSGWFYGNTQLAFSTILPASYQNLARGFGVYNGISGIEISDFGTGTGNKGIRLTTPLKTRFQFQAQNEPDFLNPLTGFQFLVSSSLRGELGSDIISSASLSPIPTTIATTSFYEMLPEEDISFWIRGVNNVGVPTPTKIRNLVIQPYIEDINAAVGKSTILNPYVTQSWIERNDTVSGSIFKIHKSQEEFYNGEFSGSNLTVTTQSLLDNPFSPSQVLDTSYVMDVTQSRGTFSSGLNQLISTYPSFSLHTNVFSFPASFDPDQIDLNIKDWLINVGNLPLTERFGKAAIFLKQSQIDFRNFFIYSILLPPVTYRINDELLINSTGELRDLFGFDGANQYIGGISDYPLPPVSASGFDGGLYASTANYPAYEYNNIGPYFKFNISGSGFIINPSLDFDTSGLAGGLESNIILSSLLGSRESITLQERDAGGNFKYLQYWMPNGSTNGQRPVRFNNTVNVSASLNTTDAVTMSIYVSNNDLAFNAPDTTPTQFGNGGWLTTQQNKAYGFGYGSGSLFVQGTTWSGSLGDSGYWVPYGLLFNRKNYDQFGNLIDNQNTIANLPNFDFSLTNTPSLGIPAVEDYYGLPGNLFRQNLNSIEGVISIDDKINTEFKSIGYSYDPNNSRLLSGSSTPLWIPSGPQPLQYVNFDPQLPPFEDFYNTPYNALINNVTQSRPNTYLQVVEYEGGSSTGSSGVPSNVIPIISGSATKADIPDSFYTQKSSILPRYLGSRLQSANYNTFTPSGSQIEYLNGYLSGSVFSGSNQFGFKETCFTAGTQITTMVFSSNNKIYNNTKNIEDVKVGEAITTYNEDSGKFESGLVGDLKISEVESIIKLTFDDGNIINTTSKHPFYVEGKNWVIAADLIVGDVCKTSYNTQTTISLIETINETTTVYNLLSVEPNHNFYANNVLVHNKDITNVISPGWNGDSSRGTMKSVNSSVGTISKHPIYFAHFKTSKQNEELYNTYTFRIDTLIECPLEDVTGNKAPQSPVTIKIDGSNDNLTDIRSTFEVDRKALIAYNQGKVKKSGSVAINYTSLPIGSNKIYQGGLEYQVKGTGQITPTTYAPTMSYNNSLWAEFKGTRKGVNLEIPTTASYYLEDNEYFNLLGFPSSSAFNFLTSSTEPALYIRGGEGYISSSAGLVNGVNVPGHLVGIGNGLSLINNYNNYVSRSIFSTGSFNQFNNAPLPGLPNVQNATSTAQRTPENYTSNIANYFTQNYNLSGIDTNIDSGSLGGITTYENFNQPLHFQKGDEVRVIYNSNPNPLETPNFVTQDFTIIDDSPNTDYENNIDVPDGEGLLISSSIYTISADPFSFFQLYAVTQSRFNYDKLIVNPDPRTLDLPIPEGKIYGYTLRKRIQADDRVIVYQEAPTGSEGIKTISPSGYLIPDDFSDQQKRNVQSIINNLSAKNVFRADEDNDTRRAPED